MKCFPASRISQVWSILGAGMAILATDSTRAAEDLTDTLHDALSAALSINPEVDAERSHIRDLSKSQLAVAEAHWLPSLTVSADAGVRNQVYDYAQSSFPYPPAEGTFNPSDLTVSLSQPLYRGGQTVAEVRVAKATLTAEAAKSRALEAKVLSEATKSYLDVAVNQELEQLRTEQVSDLRSLQEEVEKEFVAGSRTHTDVLQARARFGESINNLRSASEALEDAKIRYERYIGHAPRMLALPDRVCDLPASLTEALATAAAMNPDLAAARYNEDEAEYKISDLQGQLLPTITLALAYRIYDHPVVTQTFSLTPSRIVDEEAIVTVSMPLFQPSVYAQISGAKHAYRSAISTSGELEVSTQQSVKSGWNALSAARDRAKEAAVIVQASSDALAALRAERLAGSRSAADVLDAQRDLTNAEAEALQARLDVSNKEVALAVMIGSYDARSLHLAGSD